MTHDEGNGFRRGVLGGHDQIAFVLAILVVHHDHHLAGADVGDDIFDGIELALARGVQ
jgi:hypothetical protein